MKPERSTIFGPDFWLVLALVFFGALVGLCPRCHAASKPRETIHTSIRTHPKLTRAPAVIHAVLIVDGPEDERFYCPALTCEWGDGSRSEMETDCSPYEDRTDFQRRYYAEHLYRRGGTYTIRVMVSKGGRRIRTLDTQVRLQCAGGDFACSSEVPPGF